MNSFIFISFFLLTFFHPAEKEVAVTTLSTNTIEELLTQHNWKADEIRSQLSNNTTQYYKRGEKNNTIDYDSDILKFRKNHTGTYYYEGARFSTTWKFTDAKKTKMIIMIGYPDPVMVNLENIHITTRFFKYTQYYSGEISYLASCTRLPY
jgi:hypothetical protein